MRVAGDLLCVACGDWQKVNMVPGWTTKNTSKQHNFGFQDIYSSLLP